MAPTRTVLTTGANSGIGLAVTLDLAANGFRSVGSVRSEEKAELVAKAATDAGAAAARRVGELVSVRWDQLDFKQGTFHVRRLKSGRASVHYIRGTELRALRRASYQIQP